MAKIRHIVFNTTDPERLAKFYVDVLGLTIQHRAENGGIQLTDGYMNFRSIRIRSMVSRAASIISGFWWTITKPWPKSLRSTDIDRRSSVRATAISQNIALSIPTVTTWIFQSTDMTASGLTGRPQVGLSSPIMDSIGEVN